MMGVDIQQLFTKHDVEEDNPRQHNVCGFGCDVKTNEENK